MPVPAPQAGKYKILVGEGDTCKRRAASWNRSLDAGKSGRYSEIVPPKEAKAAALPKSKHSEPKEEEVDEEADAQDDGLEEEKPAPKSAGQESQKDEPDLRKSKSSVLSPEAKSKSPHRR